MKRQSMAINIMCPKRIWMALAVGVSFSWVPQSGYPVSLDGTVNVKYQTVSYPFSSGDEAKGFVRLNQGFSVPSGGTVSLINLLAPLAGSIELNDTGKITLDGDVHCDSNVSFVSGGVIDGDDNTIFLGGDLTIPAGKTLSIASNTVIDGQNHGLIFEAGSILKVDGAAGITLTLKNMTLYGVKSYSSSSHAIMFGSAIDQVLILENVTVNMDDYVIFTGGALSFKNRVVITGPYTFDYQASYDCTILAQSTLFLDFNTIFNYEPDDGSKLHFIFEDASSKLFLNGATLYTPLDVGLQLTKGQVFVDYKCTLMSNGGNKATKGFELGNGTAANDIAIVIAPSARLENDSALITYANQD